MDFFAGLVRKTYHSKNPRTAHSAVDNKSARDVLVASYLTVPVGKWISTSVWEIPDGIPVHGTVSRTVLYNHEPPACQPSPSRIEPTSEHLTISDDMLDEMCGIGVGSKQVFIKKNK